MIDTITFWIVMNSTAAVASANSASTSYGIRESDRASSGLSAVSWAAVFAGAIAAAALSLILLILGTGLGLSAVSPWFPSGISAGAFGVSAILWLTMTQVLASGLGGYLAGRLRSKWVAVHTDEVYFRDTAHGFLSWAVASLVSAAVLASAMGAIVSGTVQTGSAIAGATITGAAGAVAAGAGGADKAGTSAADAGNYFIDSLFRKDVTPAAANAGGLPAAIDIANTNPASEVGRIFLNNIRTGTLTADDVRYVGQLVAQRTGLSQADAEKRVSDTYARMQTKIKEAEVAAREAADKARKASAYAALWVFISLLIGAFVASLAATVGGRQRDVQMHFSTTL